MRRISKCKQKTQNKGESYIMKKCEKCGAEMKDNANFCTSCGEVLQEAANEPNEQAKVEETKINQTENSMNMQDKMGKKKNLIFVGIAVLVLIAGITMFASTMKKTIKLSDYYEITYEGGNGFGKAYAELKYEELEAAICEIKDFSMDGAGYWSVVEAVEGDYIKVDVTPNENLKNGDKVEVTFDVPNEKFIKGVNLKADSAKVKVEGLEKFKVIKDKDLFKDIEIIYTDYSPYLEVEVENKSKDEFLRTVSYSVDHSGEIANGDTITIEASWDDSIADEHKCTVNASGKQQVKVQGQAEYLLKKDMLTNEVITKIKEQIEADYRAKSLNWNKYFFSNIKEAYLVDKTNGVMAINEIYVLIEVKGEEGEILYYDGRYRDVSIRNGEIYFGDLDGGRFDVYNTRSVYDDNLENFKVNAKATYNLLE